VDKEQRGGWCGFALKRAVPASVSQVQWGWNSRKGWFRMVATMCKSLSLERGAFLLSFRVCNSGFHALLREKLSSMFTLSG
jgi:hypothetical protein